MSFELWGIIATLIIVITSLIGVATGAVKIQIQFDLNDYLKDRQENKERKRIEKISKRCFHAWVIYPANDLAQCNLCFIFIKNSTLYQHEKSKCCHIRIIGRASPLIRIKSETGFFQTNTPHNKHTEIKK